MEENEKNLRILTPLENRRKLKKYARNIFGRKKIRWSS